MKKYSLHFLIIILLPLATAAQQLPFYTQHNSNSFLINPGSTGVKRLVDARLNYRQQWLGFEGAPNTASLGINSRLAKGQMGVGLSLIQDKTGPLKKLSVGGSYAYHMIFPDCELSAGLSGVYTKSTLIGPEITLRDTQDPSIDQLVTNSTRSVDGAFGIYLYNDRFHAGISIMQPLQTKMEFYLDDTLKKGFIKDALHLNFSLGYNYSQDPDYIWQSNIYSTYVRGAPLLLDYTLILNVKQRMFGGFSIRLGDACALHLGYSFLNDFQVSYSYDFSITSLRAYSSGSHEVTLVFSTDFRHSKKGKFDDRFLRQKYGYLF
ncbi:MAG TPA: PorP/SprF family type IX secretion system membrane protein [Bacteroidia bacterium]|jgi:type IX secretion system PorP/SprF family membrane protein|nr:PorP/SprF family type IX secretion system membrane protein [Bacteroidia bacterium]